MSIFLSHPPADPHSLAEGRERQGRAAAAAGSKGQLNSLLDDLIADKDQVKCSTLLLCCCTLVHWCADS